MNGDYVDRARDAINYLLGVNRADPVAHHKRRQIVSLIHELLAIIVQKDAELDSIYGDAIDKAFLDSVTKK